MSMEWNIVCLFVLLIFLLRLMLSWILSAERSIEETKHTMPSYTMPRMPLVFTPAAGTLAPIQI